MTQKEYLMDMLEYFTVDISRKALKPLVDTALDGFQMCTYLPTATSEGCAIGRKIPDMDAKVALEAIGNLFSVAIKGRQDLIPDEMQELGWQFLCDVQMLHDTSGYWDDVKGLSPRGTRELDKIIRYHGIDPEGFDKFANPN